MGQPITNFILHEGFGHRPVVDYLLQYSIVAFIVLYRRRLSPPYYFVLLYFVIRDPIFTRYPTPHACLTEAFY